MRVVESICAKDPYMLEKKVLISKRVEIFPDVCHWVVSVAWSRDGNRTSQVIGGHEGHWAESILGVDDGHVSFRSSLPENLIELLSQQTERLLDQDPFKSQIITNDK